MLNEPVTIVNLKEVDVSVEEIIDEYVQKAEENMGYSLKESMESFRKEIREKTVNSWVACSGDQAAGFLTYGQREKNGRIGFVHVLSPYESGIFTRLITHAVTELRKKGVTRIISEVFIVRDEKTVEKTFKALGFHVLTRMVMSRDVTGSIPALTVPPGYTIRKWDDTYLDDVTNVVYNANRNGVDQLIYPQLKTREGTARLVKGIRNRAVGPFDEENSLFAFCNNELCGAVLVVRISEDEGFIADMAVASPHKGKGVGKALLTKSLLAARHHGIQTMRLGVTEENIPAVNLYRGLDFTVSQYVSAYIWEGS